MEKKGTKYVNNSNGESGAVKEYAISSRWGQKGEEFKLRSYACAGTRLWPNLSPEKAEM